MHFLRVARGAEDGSAAPASCECSDHQGIFYKERPNDHDSYLKVDHTELDGDADGFDLIECVLQIELNSKMNRHGCFNRTWGYVLL